MFTMDAHKAVRYKTSYYAVVQDITNSEMVEHRNLTVNMGNINLGKIAIFKFIIL